MGDAFLSFGKCADISTLFTPMLGQQYIPGNLIPEQETLLVCFICRWMFLTAFVDIAASSATFVMTGEQNQLFQGLEAAACVARPKGKPTNATAVRNLTRIEGCNITTAAGRRK